MIKRDFYAPFPIGQKFSIIFYSIISINMTNQSTWIKHGSAYTAKTIMNKKILQPNSAAERRPSKKIYAQALRSKTAYAYIPQAFLPSVPKRLKTAVFKYTVKIIRRTVEANNSMEFRRNKYHSTRVQPILIRKSDAVSNFPA